MTYEYEEEKNYLIQKAKEFLGGAETIWLEDIIGTTTCVTLTYFDEPLECELVGLEVGFDVDETIYVRTYSDKYPCDGADSSRLADFSNDEIKRIFDIFGIDY